MKSVLCFWLIYLFISTVLCVMIRNKCPTDEVHKSCSFFEEYTCWESSDQRRRVKSSPKRLEHCMSGCFCKRMYVRAYPKGPCIPSGICRNKALHLVMARLPTDFRGFHSY